MGDEGGGGGVEVGERKGNEQRGDENSERRMEARDPDRQAGGPGNRAQSGAGGPGTGSELSTLSAWVSSMEIAHTMNHL